MMTTDRLPVSVCMAVYNGEKYLKEQIDSILSQLTQEQDELIIVDDFSKDNSVAIINEYQSPIIKLKRNRLNLGYVKTFEIAITASQNPIIFLSDQDDIWIEGRVMDMCDTLMSSSGSMLICSNFKSFSQAGDDICRFKTRLRHYIPERFCSNIWGIFKGKMAYFGCTMAFTSEFKKFLLPFPKYIEAHDLWMAMLGNSLGSIIHMEADTVMHRIHGGNASFVKRDLKDKMWTRFVFLRSLMEALNRKDITKEAKRNNETYS